MVLIEVQITKGMNEIAGAQSADLRDHRRQQGVGRNVEGNAEKEIGTPLIQLAT